MKKDNSGITLLSLVITIIILLILASITVYSGISTIRSAGLTKFTTELKMMQQKVNELYDSYTKNKAVTVKETEYVGADIQNIGQNLEDIGDNFNTDQLGKIFSENGSGITDITGYMYYDTETITALGLENMEYEFFVNVAKRSVVSTEGYDDNGKIYYTLDQVPDGVYNVEYNGISNDVTFDTTTEVQNGQGKIHVTNISSNEYVNKWQVKYRLKAKEGDTENSWITTEEFTESQFTIDIPIENLLKDYEIQIVHGDEIVSEIKTAHVLQVGDYIDYDPTNGGTITTTYTSPQGTYHANQAAAIADTSENMIQGNGYADQTFNVEAETNGWRVLGVDEKTNQILLISADIVTTESTDNGYFYLRGQTGYEWGIKELNNICEIFGKGNGASGARSITAEDINKITGYQTETTPYGKGSIYEYGNKVKYTKNSSDISYQDTLNNKSGTYGDSNTIFKFYDEENNLWKTLTQGKSQSLRSSVYYYFPNTLTTSSSGETVGISTEDVEYEMLFEKNSSKQTYWLMSQYIVTDTENAIFALRLVGGGRVNGSRLFGSDGITNNGVSGIRPIVSLNTNVNVSGGAGTEEEPYEIK